MLRARSPSPHSPAPVFPARTARPSSFGYASGAPMARFAEVTRARRCRCGAWQADESVPDIHSTSWCDAPETASDRRHGQRVPHEYHNAGGGTVESVCGDDIRLPIPFAQAHQCRFAIPHAARRGCQKMRLVHDNDALVLIDHREIERDVRFLDHPAMSAVHSTVTDLARLRGLSTS